MRNCNPRLPPPEIIHLEQCVHLRHLANNWANSVVNQYPYSQLHSVLERLCAHENGERVPELAVGFNEDEDEDGAGVELGCEGNVRVSVFLKGGGKGTYIGSGRRRGRDR